MDVMIDAYEQLCRDCSGRLGLVVTLAITVLVLSGCGPGDRVVLLNASGSPNIFRVRSFGVLVDGQSGNQQVNDQAFSSDNTTISIGQLNRGSSNEVITFGYGLPVAIRQSVPWTSGDDIMSVSFPSQIMIPVKVWIVKGPFSTQRTRAINASLTTTGIWYSERMGVAFSQFDIVDATADPQASNYYNFNCSMQTGIETDIGKTPGRINIYYVDTVDGGIGRGQACVIGSDFVAMGSASGNELLVHEIGHDFGLDHIDDLAADFDQTNIMHSASNTRQFITEGQLFRAHLTSTSALNFLYSARVGLPTRNCARDTTNNQCPQIRKRVFPDGTFPAN